MSESDDFITGEVLQVVTRAAFVLDSPNDNAEITSELLHGESVEIIEDREDYILIKNQTDGYEGYVHKETLSDEYIEPTHKIIAPQSLLYQEPDYKKRPLTALPFLSQITTTGKRKNGFAEIEGETWIWEDHIAPITHHQRDMVRTAHMFIGTPYLWGGKTPRGLDCSGLVQLCAFHAGHSIPRDSKDQISCGQAITLDNIRQGDLVFFKGHVGLMADNKNVINATSRTMDTRIETLNDMILEYEGGILDIRRL